MYNFHLLVLSRLSRLLRLAISEILVSTCTLNLNCTIAANRYVLVVIKDYESAFDAV